MAINLFISKRADDEPDLKLLSNIMLGDKRFRILRGLKFGLNN